MKRSVNFAAVLAALLLMLPAGTLPAKGQGEAKALNFALSGNPDTLDPHKTAGTLTFQTLKSVYDTLVEPDQSEKLVPALAERWEVSADGLTWTFSLRQGVLFHNGDRLTAKDVKATFERIKAKETASPKANEFAAISGIQIPNDAMVVIKLSQPYAPFLATLASGWGAILPKSLIDSGHDFAAKPVGTGPFKLVEWVRDSRIVLEKNPGYWLKGAPKLEKVIMNIIPERAVQVQGLLSGQIDAVEFVDKDDLKILEANPEVKVDKQLTALILVMGINCSNPILQDLRVRQALNYAVDKQQVLDVAYGGGKVIGTFMDVSNAFYKDFTGLYPYNPEKAKSLLQEAGVPKEASFDLVLPQNYELHVKAGQLIQEMLTRVGLNVKIKLVDWPTWLSEVYKAAKYDLTVVGHTGKLDPDGTLAGYGKKDRYVRWENPRAADLITQAAKTVGGENRKKLYDEALELMAREVPFVYLGSSYRYVAFRKSVVDFRMTPKLDTFDFRWTELK